VREAKAHHSVPARLTTAGDGSVHHVVSNEEVSLELQTSKGREKKRRLSAFDFNGMVTGKEKRTSSMHHPRRAALRYSSSVSEVPFKISTVSTTEIPRLSLPARVNMHQLELRKKERNSTDHQECCSRETGRAKRRISSLCRFRQVQ
jgi:hypothetical protein